MVLMWWRGLQSHPQISPSMTHMVRPGESSSTRCSAMTASSLLLWYVLVFSHFFFFFPINYMYFKENKTPECI